MSLPFVHLVFLRFAFFLLVPETYYLKQVYVILKLHFSTSCSCSVSNFIKTVRISLPPHRTALVAYGTYSLETVSDSSQDTRYVRLTNIIRQHIPNCHLSGQSEQRKTSKVTNEDLQQLHASELKRGKTRVAKPRSVLYLHVIGFELVQVFWTNHKVKWNRPIKIEKCDLGNVCRSGFREPLQWFH